MAGDNTIKLTLVRSTNGRLQSHKDTVRGLGLGRLHHSVEVSDKPENRGMVNKISFMLKVEE